MNINLTHARTILGSFVEVEASQVNYDLYSKVTDYKSRTASKFSSLSKDLIGNIAGNEFYISLKLDGENCALYYDADLEDQAFLIRPRGYVYAGLPCLEAARTVLREKGIRKCLLPGELYVKRADGARTRIFDVIHHTKAPKTQADLEALHFAPFDILTLNDEVFVDFAEIVGRLKQFEGTAIAPPPIQISRDKNDIIKAYDHWVNVMGCEGLMVRTDQSFRYKIKAVHTVDAVIIGYTYEGEMITSVLTGLVTPTGDIQILAPVEKGFSDVQKVDLCRRLREMHTPSDYLEVSRFHTPFYMVRPKIIIEFSSNDMVTERANGMAIKTAVLRLKDGTYRLQRSAPLVSMRHCVFIRERDDKSVNEKDLRLSQITDNVFVDVDREPSKDISFPKPDILAREVYVKETKGKVSVRKLVAWQTNKEHIDSAYTRYVFNYTDYSPGRQQPLQQEVRVSSNKAQILEILAEYRDKNVKTGWKRERTTE